MRALVTGAHGFLGRHVALRLHEIGYLVTGIGHGAWEGLEQSRFGVSSWHSTDITSESLVQYADDPDVIVHCAGSGSVAFSMTQPYQDYARTVSNTAAVLEYLRLHSPRTVLIYPSSAAVYGLTDRLPMTESHALNPASPYGLHKLMAEQLCRSYASHFGIVVAMVRFFSIYGEGLKKQLLWDACTRAAQGQNIFFGTGIELRDWIHVKDAASLIEAAIGHASFQCPVVNGGSGEGVSVSEILLETFRLFGASQRPAFSGNARPGDPPGYHADTSAARAWGWQPQIDWQEGISRYVRWFKEQMQ